MGFPVVLIPWVVLQEMDSLKRGKDLLGSVAHLAIPAISYIYNSLKSREPHLWGQSMQQAAESASKCCFRKQISSFKIGQFFFFSDRTKKKLIPIVSTE